MDDRRLNAASLRLRIEQLRENIKENPGVEDDAKRLRKIEWLESELAQREAEAEAKLEAEAESGEASDGSES